MKRVVVTGLGVVSCLGNDKAAVVDSLREGRSGIRFMESYQEAGLNSHVAGLVDIDLKEHIDRKDLRFMGDAAAYCHIAMTQAIADAGLSEDLVSQDRTGVIAGSGGASPNNTVLAADSFRNKGIRRVLPFMVPRTMCSTIPACLSTAFKIRGLNYSISSACATSTHCIGHAMEQIQAGRQDIIFAGGGDEEHWALTIVFDAMRALSTKYNDTPTTASRPYDATRDGFVIAGGGGMLVLEELDHALARGAHIHAEVVGYGATSDGADMVAPSGEGAARAMRQAMATVEAPIDYINTHGTSTPVGDIAELKALAEVFGGDVPPISSSKSLGGHALGAAGVHEAIHCLLMLEHDFLLASANIETLDEEAVSFPIVRERKDNAGLTTVMSNSFGFGGTNGCLVFQRYRP